MDLNQLKNYSGEDKVISNDILESEFLESKNDGFLYPTRIPTLDRLLDGGVKTGELYAISGPTKNGKTLLAQTMTVNFLQGPARAMSLWFTYEVPPRQFFSQFPSPLPLFYMPRRLKSHDMDWVADRIVESFLKYHTRIVFIDHLHYLFDMVKAKSPSLEIGTVVRRLKGLAVEHNLVVFLMCHTAKVDPEELTYRSIRDSSFVAQESDSVWLVRRQEKKLANSAELIVEFHRRTGVMEKNVLLAKASGLLVETFWTSGQDPKPGGVPADGSFFSVS